MNKKAFSDNQRIHIVKLHIEKGRTIKSLHEEFNVAESTISRWIIKFRNGAMSSTNTCEGNDR